MKLIKYPNPILNQVSETCTEADLDLIKSSYEEMNNIMKQYKGYGLAAVQVGILKRFCLLTNSHDVDKPYVIINPELITSDELEKKEEGCLSLPLLNESVERFNDITIKFRDETWEEKTASFQGLDAQCLQHEIEHMQGKLLIDNLSLLKKQFWLKKASKRGLI